MALGVCLLLAACSGPKLDGRWVGDRELRTPPGGDPLVASTLGKLILEFEPGDRFELRDSGLPKAGKVRYAGEKAYLRVDTFFGKPIETQGDEVAARNAEIELTPQKDGSLLYYDPKGYDGKSVVLRRESQPGP